MIASFHDDGNVSRQQSSLFESLKDEFSPGVYKRRLHVPLFQGLIALEFYDTTVLHSSQTAEINFSIDEGSAQLEFGGLRHDVTGDWLCFLGVVLYRPASGQDLLLKPKSEGPLDSLRFAISSNDGIQAMGYADGETQPLVESSVVVSRAFINIVTSSLAE